MTSFVEDTSTGPRLLAALRRDTVSTSWSGLRFTMTRLRPSRAKKNLRNCGGIWRELDLEIHAAHAAAGGHAGAGALVLLWHFGHHGFGGDQESRNRSCVLDRRANHLGRVDDALGDQVDIFAGLRVEAVGILILFEDLADDHRAVLARIDRDLARGPGKRLADDFAAG